MISDPWRQAVQRPLGLLVVIAALGCDVGDPVSPGTVDPYAVERPDILLLEWEAQGAIPAADVNRDGTVDILDLIIVAQNYGQDIVVEDPPVRVDAWEVKQMDDLFWSYKLTLTNASPHDQYAFFKVELFDAEGFYISFEIVGGEVPGGSTMTERSMMVISPNIEYYDEDGNRVLSVDTFPRNAEEFVALFKQ